jgi:bifunctional DNase/RNase
MELRRIIINEMSDQQIIVLKEAEGERSFPIVIGTYEAASISRRVRGDTTPRPMPHDLVVSVIEQLGGEVQDILINDLVQGTYYALLRIRHDGELINVDCRPSDAIAVAVTLNVPIYVNESVLGEALEDNDET